MEKKITENFTYNEFACKGEYCCKNSHPIDINLVYFLQKFRDIINVPIIITSGFRCITHNNSIGGAEYSAHTYGRGIDFYTPDIDNEKLCNIFIGFCHYKERINIILYDTFIHFDNMRKKTHRSGVQLSKSCGD